MALRLVAILAMLIAGGGVCMGADDSARDALAAQLGALHSIKTLQADFVCDKRIAALEQPLVSGGTITVAGADQLRFSTLRPYVSEIILDHGKLLLKSEHETSWTRATSTGRPGLSAIMEQMAGWSLGDISKLDETYKVAGAAGSIPKAPGDSAATQAAMAKVSSPAMFLLTPIKPELSKAVASLTLGVDPTTHYLLFLQLTTADQDVTRYWFYNIKTNAQLAPAIFSPAGAAHE